MRQRSRGFLRLGVAATLATGIAGCAPAAVPLAAGTGGVAGALRLVPHEGVTPSAGGGAYGDRRLRDVTLVDYSRPGFAVVWLDGGRPPAVSAELAIRELRGAADFAPAAAAVGTGGTLRVRNDGAGPHVVSCPAVGLLRRLAPGETVEMTLSVAGEAPVFLLDAPEARAEVFAASGPFVVPDEDGRFVLRDLPPGPAWLRAWHPRFPTSAHHVDVPAGALLPVDFELGVDRPQSVDDARP